MTTDAKTTEGSGRCRYTFRLRLSSTARHALETEWDRCRWIWNECVAKSKAVHLHNKAHPEDKQTCGPVQLAKMLTEARAVTPWLAIRLKDGRLHLAGGTVLRVVWSRALPRPPSSVRVYRDSIGHWYASFVVATTAEALPATGRVIGIDWGVKETATTTSDAHDLPHAQHGKAAAQKLAKYQRMMARRRPKKGRPGSKGYREAKRQTAKLHKKVARQRQDTGRKWAKRVVRDHDALAVEDFQSKFLTKSTMARKAADAVIGATKAALVEMGRKHGRDVRLVHPAHTTMDCAQCGARTKHALPLSERTYACTACGAVSPRDKNSARVMLVRAGLQPGWR